MVETDRLLHNSSFARLSAVDILESENPSDSWGACIRNQVRYYDGVVVNYNTDFLMNCGWLLPYGGGVVTLGTIFWLLVGCGAAFGLALAKCEDDSDKAYEFDCIPLPNDYKFLTLGASALVVQAIFTLFLMWRWQASRDYITKIVAAHHSLVANLAVHLGENAGGMRAQARASAIHSATTFLRYVNLGHAIIYVKAAGDDKENRDKALDAMVGRGLLQPGEESYVRMVDSPSAVFAWAVLQLDKMIKVGTVEECHNIKQVSTHLREIIDNCQDVLTSTEHQLPYPFVQLIMLVQAVFISQLVMVCGGVIGDAITDDVYVTSGVVTGCVTLVTMLLVSLCMSNLFNQLCNPMGKEGPNAFPQNYYVAKIEKDTKVVFDLLYQAGMNGVTNKSRK